MDFRSIIRRITKSEEVEVEKGDLPGHDFHGNQWIDSRGGFAVKPLGGRGGRKAPEAAAPRKPAAVRQPKPRAVRQPKPAPAPTPTPSSGTMGSGTEARIGAMLAALGFDEKFPPSAQPPETPEPAKADPNYNPKADGALDNFKGLKTNEIVSQPEKFDVGAGAQQKFMGKVEMADGSTGLVKQIGDWRGTPGEILANHEILASQIGEAINAPIRSALAIQGQPDSVVQTFLPTAESLERLGEGGRPFESASSVDWLPDAVKVQVGEGRFFNVMVGNGDDHAGNWLVDNYNVGFFFGRQMFNEDTKVTPIDYSLAFRASFPPEPVELQYTAKEWKIPDERIGSMMDNINTLLKSGKLDDSKRYSSGLGAQPMTDVERVSIMSQRMAQAFPHLVKP